MNTIWEPAKYHGKWAVFDRESNTFSHIGMGKKFCTEKARALNNTEYAAEILSKTMKKEDAKSKTLELAKEMFARVEGKIDKALNSGCVDLGAYHDDYALPIIILNAIMMDLCDESKPPLKKWQKESNNIYKFL